MIPVLIIVSMLSFGVVMVLPGDPAVMMLGEQSSNDQSAYQALRAQLGLDRPLPVQYLDWAGRALRGDFGVSLRDHLPISASIGAHVAPTVELALLGLLFGLAVAIP